MEILNLNLKKKWFDMTLSGEKKEEYREIKPFWVKRLCDAHPGMICGDLMDRHKNIAYTIKNFDITRLMNGMAKDAPVFTIKHKRIRIGTGRAEWGAEPGKEYFIISHGEILETRNI